MSDRILQLLRPAWPLAVIIAALVHSSCSTSSPTAADHEHPVTFEGGYDLVPSDLGRPVVLIAAALGVEPDVFREAFRKVTPVRGRAPSSDEARSNKEALLKVLAPHGVTNERLDEVSDYYRFRPEAGGLWRTRPAQAHAVVVAGKINEIVITDPGSGYSSPPFVSVEGFPKTRFQVTLGFSRDLEQNGAVTAIKVFPEPQDPGSPASKDQPDVQ